MKKTAKWLCLLMALLLVPVSALAYVRLPVWRGNVTDDADVLSQQTAADLAQYAQLLEEETEIRFNTAIVHFLDGLDAQTYAERLFEYWDLQQNDMLVLVAAGEDLCATIMGDDAAEKLGSANAENLMYTSSDFSRLIRSQQYDAAFQAYGTALNALVEKQTGTGVSLGTLFGSQPLPAPIATDYASHLWSDVVTALETSGEAFEAQLERMEDEENGLTAGGWIVLLILAGILTDKKRKGRRGCGCSPLGWLFGLLGLGFLFNRD